MSAASTGWSSLTSADLLVSLRVPDGWDVTVLDKNSFRLQRDPPDDGGYHATVSVSGTRPERSGRDWFDDFAGAVTGQLAADVPGFELIATDRYSLSSQAAVVAVQARQEPAGLSPTSQLEAWVWVNSYRMLVVGASTLREHEQRDLPVFDTIVRSLRVLPARLIRTR